MSKARHVNCKSGSELKKILNKFFDHIFIFSMNDEVGHTVFLKMANYLVAIFTGKK